MYLSNPGDCPGVLPINTFVPYRALYLVAEQWFSHPVPASYTLTQPSLEIPLAVEPLSGLLSLPLLVLRQQTGGTLIILFYCF